MLLSYPHRSKLNFGSDQFVPTQPQYRLVFRVPMSINSDDESSFDLGGGVDLFIQDTQENMTSCGGAVQSEDDGKEEP